MRSRLEIIISLAQTNYSSLNINDRTCATIMNIFISFNNGSLARRRGKGGKYQQQIQVQSNRDGPNINEKF